MLPSVQTRLVIDELILQAGKDRVVFKKAYVLIHDISTELDDGTTVTLDGIIGTNLMLPSMAGLSLGLPSQTSDGPFAKVWVDLPRSMLRLHLRE